MSFAFLLILQNYPFLRHSPVAKLQFGYYLIKENPSFFCQSRFLLKYVSRDEVAVLSRGTGGVPEMRNTIDAYDENSPLYGFLQYRRRKVVLKYMPDGLSRLIQGTDSSAMLSRMTMSPLTMSTDSLYYHPLLSSKRSPLPVHHRHLLSERYRLLSRSIVGSHRKRTLVCMPAARRVRLYHLLVELTPGSAADGNNRGC